LSIYAINLSITLVYWVWLRMFAAMFSQFSPVQHYTQYITLSLQYTPLHAKCFQVIGQHCKNFPFRKMTAMEIKSSHQYSYHIKTHYVQIQLQYLQHSLGPIQLNSQYLPDVLHHNLNLVQLENLHSVSNWKDSWQWQNHQQLIV